MSLEVSPDLAHDTAGTLAEARRLWKAVSRPNVMIKVPATPAGLPAIRTLISEGINVNVTLLFARDAYEAVAEAFIAGLEARAAAGQPLAHVASVASFFVSRIDTAVDALLEEKLKSADGEEKSRIERLLGKVAIANAKLAYQSYKNIFSGARWDALRAKGAQTQRVLWASTGTKNPALPRRPLRRGADRTGHRQHRPARDVDRLPRSRSAARKPRRRRGRRDERAGRSDRPSASR